MTEPAQPQISTAPPLPGFSEEARLMVREYVREMAAQLERLPMRPLPQVRQTNSQYTWEGERVASGISRMLLQSDAESQEERTALLESFAEKVRASGKPLDKFLPPSDTPFARAQDLVYEAHAANGRKRIKLARRALALFPDCADALLLLAHEDAANEEDAAKLIRQAVEAAQRTIQSTLSEEFWQQKTEFWRVLPARPYLRARLAQAESRWQQEQHEAALADWRELLALDADDHLGARYQMAVALLDVNRDEEVATLLDQWDDFNAHWTYTRLLLSFRRNRRIADADLQAAFAANPSVALAIVGLMPLAKLPQKWRPNSEGEVVEYLVGSLRLWVTTPGAIEALAEAVTRDLQEYEARAKAEANSSLWNAAQRVIER